MDLRSTRNFGVVAHIDAGKTTVSERMLYLAGVEHRVGLVDEGTAVMDWMPEERERGITITAAATTLPWKNHTFHLIDTPGHVDFTVEVERCMRVLDGAVLVIDAVAGVQAQSETVWRQMRKHRVAAVAFVNKCDRPGADFLSAVESLRSRLEAPALPLQYPLFREGALVGVVDLVTMRAWEADSQASVPPREIEIPSAQAEDAAVLRSELVDALAGEDEALFEAVLAEHAPDPSELKRALRRQVVELAALPVLCGAALRNVGVRLLMDAVADYLPSPVDVPPVEGVDPRTHAPVRRPCRADHPASLLAFKIFAESHGDLTFARIYSGEIHPGSVLFNPRVRRDERVARVLRMHADSRTALDRAGPGEIVALTGLKFTSTGDTLCDREHPIALEPPSFPEPVISMVAEPELTGDRDHLRQALERLAREDPTLSVREDEETGQWLVGGMGELHLEIVQHRLANDFHVAAKMGRPRVAYREALRRPAAARAVVERSLGGREIYGGVEVELRPLADSTQVSIVWEGTEVAERVRVDGNPGKHQVPLAFQPAVEESLKLGAQAGPQFGYPLAGVLVAVVGGMAHPGRESEVAFTQAASLALRQAMQEAGTVLLEPLMSFEIDTPAEFASAIIADLNGRRAEIGAVEARGAQRAVSGTVPLANMFGYSTAVRSLSQGRAGFSMEPSGFRPVPDEDLSARGLAWT